MTSHGPFNNARNYYNNKLYDDISDNMVKDYFNSMSYVDESIKNYIANIKVNNKNTYILIWGDHTPHIDTSLYKEASYTYDKEYFEFVPLIIMTPDNKVYKEEKKVASFLDISSTVLFSSGIAFELNSNGQNLIGSNELTNKIPFKGNNYDRETLFEKLPQK